VHEIDQLFERKDSAPDELCVQCRERGLEPYDPHQAPREAPVLLERGVRRMVGRDHVDRSVEQPLDQRVLILFRADRRVHLEAPVVLEHCVVQKQIVRRGLAAHVDAARLRLSDQLDALLCRDVADVVAAACFLREREVARDRPPLALGRNAPEAVRERVTAPVDDPTAGKRVVLAVRGDDLPEPLCLEHRRLHQRRVLHAAPVVGKRRDERSHGPHIGERLALFADRQRAERHYLHARAPADAVELRFEVFEGIRHRVHVRHRAHVREPAARRRERAGLDRLLIRKTRLSQVHMHVDEAGNEDAIRQINNSGIGESGNFRRNPGNNSAVHEHILAREPPGREQPPALEKNLHARTSPQKKILPSGKIKSQRKAGRFSKSCRSLCTELKDSSQGIVSHAKRGVKRTERNNKDLGGTYAGLLPRETKARPPIARRADSIFNSRISKDRLLRPEKTVFHIGRSSLVGRQSHGNPRQKRSTSVLVRHL